MIVYAVSRGSYSDYSVLCAFTRQVDAEQYAAADADRQVEELDLYDTLGESRSYHVMMTTVRQVQGGGTAAEGTHESSRTLFDGLDDGPRSDRAAVTVVDNTYGRPSRHIRAEGYDLGHVRQAFSDAVAAATAELETLP